MKKSLGPNTLAQPTPVWLVGSYDEAGKPNIMTIAWGGICCSKPACLTVSVRKERHTYPGVLQHKAFTVSIPGEALVREADFAGMASGKSVDKFAAARLTAVKSDLVDAPYVDQCPMVIECRLLQAIDLGAHTQFIGEIVDVKADEDVLAPEGHVDPLKLKPLVFAPGASAYYGLGHVVGKAFSIGKSVGE
jgi:flavin reductase (DIM6/NTAB) family NADH-FMN oxidoreductase RutF